MLIWGVRAERVGLELAGGSQQIGRGGRLFSALSAREGESREDVGNNVILVSLVLDFEGVFREAKDPAL